MDARAVDEDYIREQLQGMLAFFGSLREELPTAPPQEFSIYGYEARHDLGVYRSIGELPLGDDLRALYDEVGRLIASYGGWLEQFARGETGVLPPGRDGENGVQ